MEPPRPRDIAHDLRNLIGLVRAVSQDLGTRLEAATPDVRLASADLEHYSSFAMDALRVIERWEQTAATEVSVGAWAWALRLGYRELRVGEVWNTARITIVVPAALDAGSKLLRALGGGKLVDVEHEREGVAFHVAGRAVEPEAVSAAIDALAKLGFAVVQHAERPCRIRVAAAA